MEELNEDKWDISYCGLNCASCDIYLASHGDDELQKKILQWFQENIDSNINDISCEKCRGPTNKCWTEDCKLRSCAIKMNVKYCYECPEFVCSKLYEFANNGLEHHKRTVENMKKIRKIGLKKWKSLQKEPQFCP
jgi:hypothetical protein